MDNNIIEFPASSDTEENATFTKVLDNALKEYQQELRIERIVKDLEYYNEWRKGGTKPMPNPVELGDTIDQAIAILKGYIPNDRS